MGGGGGGEREPHSHTHRKEIGIERYEYGAEGEGGTPREKGKQRERVNTGKGSHARKTQATPDHINTTHPMPMPPPPSAELTRCVALGVLAFNAAYKGEPSRFLEGEGPGLAEWLVLHTTLRSVAPGPFLSTPQRRRWGVFHCAARGPGGRGMSKAGREGGGLLARIFSRIFHRTLRSQAKGSPEAHPPRAPGTGRCCSRAPGTSGSSPSAGPKP